MRGLVNVAYGRFLTGRPAWGLLLLRLVVGGAFVQHGLSKIQAPFGWMGPHSTVPGLFQGLAALSEFGGGLALILGFLTPLAALGIASTMIVAYTMVHGPAGHAWIASKPGQGSFEDVAFYLAAALALFFTGPGALSLDRVLFGRHTADETRNV